MDWNRTESMHRTNLQFPSIVVAYNLFMNGVDLVDQMRASQAMERRECRLTMTMLSFMMDCAMNNALSMYKSLKEDINSGVSLSSFKREVAESLIKPWLAIKLNKQNRCIFSEPRLRSTEVQTHMLLENSPKNQTNVICVRFWTAGRWKHQSIAPVRAKLVFMSIVSHFFITIICFKIVQNTIQEANSCSQNKRHKIINYSTDIEMVANIARKNGVDEIKILVVCPWIKFLHIGV